MKTAKLVPLVLALVIVAGCETTPPPAAVPPPTVAIRAKVPEISPLPETKESQEKGGVEISVAPASYKTERKTATTKRPIQASVMDMLMVSKEARHTMTFMEYTTTEKLTTVPGRVAFTVKINNQLNRVFRGAGTVVQFNVGGKLVAVDQSGYSELAGAIVPPRSELQITVFGPALDVLPDKAVIGLFFYDVVTATDVAGNVSEKQNYEWYFDYSSRLVEEQSEIRRTRGWE